MEFHEIASLFPLLEGEEFKSVVEDIKNNGLIEPITTYGGKILDGRNRYRACIEAGVEPRFEEYKDDDPLGFVISKNLKRRHLNESQKALIAVRMANMPAHRPDKSASSPTYLQLSASSPKVSQPEAAKIMGVSDRTMRRIKQIEREAPEFLSKIESGDITAVEAVEIIKNKKHEQRIEEQRKNIEEGKIELPRGKYEVIVIDPPWPYGTEYDSKGRRSASPYPEMSLEELIKLDLPTSDNCILFLWTTHKFMRHSFDLIDVWGFRDVAIITWVKNRMGLGEWLRSQSEFCIMCVKGTPTINLTNQTTVVYGPLREHSRKPDEFYKMVDELCIGRKLDYFGREKREGWECFGVQDYFSKVGEE